ncbi:multicopper oxidase family protein [Actinophytocola oryzae]|uniref:FtsP/CotA-like multicopper oxidase with cupredoxin domain n=1 Tax=Actinophytocola oryzae TaxID=502181 RepID=A0A4R7UZR6_9PSEU|nr:multicopper oxidase family protein [Actinophytocola oryzae]TDV41045.1 FtsP/CotA-like multicopper oxidase with cupredoxin domain [Actinophytocola oryzae]
MNRRKLLACGGIAAGGALAGLPLLAVGRPVAAAAPRGPVFSPYSEEMPVPPVLVPEITDAADVYRLTVREATATIVPGLRTPVLTYGGAFPGPTIRARQGRPVQVVVTNELDRAVDTYLHGGLAEPDPRSTLDPGRARTYEYGNARAGASLWYHDHTGAEPVYRGLQGWYLLEGADEAALNLPSGDHDIPIVLGDASFDERGALVWGAGGRGTLLANGKARPYFLVAARKYRFRLLNGSVGRVFRLDLSGTRMTQIATDGGLLPAPVPLTELVLGPGERAEVVVDFRDLPLGAPVILNDASGEVLRFDVVREAADTSQVPATLRPLPTPSATRTWTVTNEGAEAHTFHPHQAQFLVLDRAGRPPGPGEAGWKDTVLIRPAETVRLAVTGTSGATYDWPGRTRPRIAD